MPMKGVRREKLSVKERLERLVRDEMEKTPKFTSYSYGHGWSSGVIFGLRMAISMLGKEGK